MKLFKLAAMYSTLLEKLSKAIGARLLVRFCYNSKTYIVEPHLLGRNSAAQDCLSAWLKESDANQELAPGWHCFLLEEIKELKLLNQNFNKPRPGYDPYDNTMNRIYYRI